MDSKKCIKPVFHSKLSYREICCLRLSALDKRCKEIAELLFLSERTVQKHLYRSRKKLGCHTIQGAVYKAMRQELL